MKQVRKSPIRKILALPTGDVVFFPGCVTFVVLNKSGFRQKTVDKAMARDRMLLLLSEDAGAKALPEIKDITRFGTIGRITETETLADGSSRVRIDGVQRAKVIRLTRRAGVFEAQAHTIEERSGKLGRVADQQKLLEAFNTDGPLECIKQAIDRIAATLKSKS